MILNDELLGELQMEYQNSATSTDIAIIFFRDALDTITDLKRQLVERDVAIEVAEEAGILKASEYMRCQCSPTCGKPHPTHDWRGIQDLIHNPGALDALIQKRVAEALELAASIPDKLRNPSIVAEKLPSCAEPITVANLCGIIADEIRELERATKAQLAPEGK